MKLITILRSHSSRNVGNINSQLLYRDAYNSTKKLIEEYQHQVVKCLQSILSSDLPILKKLEFFGQLRHSVGRSALLLSGGAILGMHHIGVVQTLIEADCMPTIIAGSSAGSMIAALVATRSRQQFFDGKSFNFKAFILQKKKCLWKHFKRVAKSGYILEIDVLKQFLKDNLGDITFQEAFDKFGYILNITVTGTGQHDENRLLNYLTAPNVMIWSACAASCAIPLIYGATNLYSKDIHGQIKPYTLMNRKFVDGSIGQDLPMNKLSIFFNVNNFIVSQTNPWVIPFMDYTQQFRTTSNPIFMRIFIFIHRIKEFMISQLKHRLDQMTYVFPGAITKFFNLATQSYVGNITIWPVPSLSDYLRILENPTSFEMLLSFIEHGRQRTYPSKKYPNLEIRQIQSSLFFEKEINRCFKRAKRQSFMDIRKISMNGGKEFSEMDDDQYLPPIKIHEVEVEEMGTSTKMKYRNRSYFIPREDSYDRSY